MADPAHTGQNGSRINRPIPHLVFLDGLRGLAAIYVVLHHTAIDVRFDQSPLHIMLQSFLAYGHYAVDVFIVLSGFCLMLPVIRSGGNLPLDPRRFYFRRAERILPPYYACCLITLALATTVLRFRTGTHWDRALPVTWQNLIYDVALIQDALAPTHLNPVFWSIAVECHIYLLFPVLLASWRRWDPVLTTVLVSIGTFAVFVPLINTRWILVSPHYLGLFMMGMLAATIATSSDPRWDRWKAAPWTAISVAGAALIPLLLIVWFWKGVFFVLLDPLVGFVAASVMISCVVDPSQILFRKALDSRILTQVGVFAYSIYLVHAPVLALLRQYVLSRLHLNNSGELLFLLITTVPVVLGIALVFHRLFERPFLKSRLR